MRYRIAPALAAAALFAAGCGYIGGPLPPLANVPAPVRDLAAVQRGARILVSFTVPSHTTEGLAIRRALELDLRIGAAAEPFHAEEWAAQATQVPPAPVVQGIARYEIPAAQWTGKEAAIGVRVIGANGKQAGWSNYALVPVVPPPDKPVDLKAENTAAGIHLAWHARGDRFRVLRRTGSESFTPVATVPRTEWTDGAAQFGAHYSYQVQTIVNLGNTKEAESDASDPVTFTPLDEFPPAPPTGLRATAAPNSIELAWDQNSEPDLAGYRIYRSAADGPFEKIAIVNEIPSYSDQHVEHGKTYRYALTAVDKSGNESARSVAAETAFP